MKKKTGVIKRKPNNKMDPMEVDRMAVDRMFCRLANLIRMLYIHPSQQNPLKTEPHHLLLLKVLPRMIKNSNSNKNKTKRKMKRKLRIFAHKNC